MKKSLLSLPIILGIIVLISVPTISAQSESEIPSWIKIIAGAWFNDEIDDATFSDAMEFLIENNIIQIENPIYMAEPEESEQIEAMQKIIDDLENDKTGLESQVHSLEEENQDMMNAENREWYEQEIENMRLIAVKAVDEKNSINAQLTTIRIQLESTQKQLDELKQK